MNDQTPETLIYRPIPTSLGAKIVYGLVLVFLLTIPFIQPLKDIALNVIEPPLVTPMWIITILICLFLGLQTKNKIILKNDSIQKHRSIFFKFYVQKSDIAAIQAYSFIPELNFNSKNKKYFRFHMKNGDIFDLNKIPYNFDQNFYEWISQFPDYTSMRKDKIKKLNFVEKFIFYFPYIILLPFLIIYGNVDADFLSQINISQEILFFLYPIPLIFLILVKIYPDRFTFSLRNGFYFYTGKSEKPKIAIGIVWYISTIILYTLYLAHLFNSNTLQSLLILDTIIFFPYIFVVGYILIFILILANPISYMTQAAWSLKIRALSKFGLSLLLPLFFVFLFMFDPINSIYDFSDPDIHQTKIVKKFENKKSEITEYGILVLAWDGYQNVRYLNKNNTIGSFGTSKKFYDSVEENEILCVYEYNGLFNRPWLRLDYCPEDLKSTESK